jgi:nucleoporin POM152
MRGSKKTTTGRSSSGGPGSGSRRSGPRSSLPEAPEANADADTPAPVIPLTILDAPAQRFYAAAVYCALWAYKFYDWIQLVEDNDVSLFLFLKWIFIDFAFIFGLPELRIPWLELSSPTVSVIFGFHALMNYMLMFSVPVCHRASFED